MHFHYLLVVSVVGLIFVTASAAKLSADTIRVTGTSFPQTLRTSSVGDSSEEERAGGGISVSTSEKFAKFFASSKVTDDQLQKWLGKGKSADYVFYRMNLAKAGTWIFDDPKFIKWVQYADKLSATTDGKGTSAISALTAQYGDDQLYKIIKEAKRDSGSEKLVSRLQAEQLKRWISVGKDPDEVYKLYDLNYASSRLLHGSRFSAWVKYVDDLNAKHDGAVSIIPTLRKYYKDVELFKMAEAAKSVKEAESMGLKLDDAFVQFWINDKKTPVQVLKDLQLETLESPLFGLLVKFTDAYNAKFPQTKTTMIETLTNAFGDVNVAKMLATMKTNHGKAKKIATELEAAQLQMWLSSGKSVDDVYELMRLPFSKIVNDFTGIPLFPVWIAYLNTFSIQNPEKISKMFSRMATQFDDRPMMQILQAAEKFPSMEKIAAKLQLQLSEKVLSTEVSPREAFTMLALHSVGDSVLGSPVFTKWLTYVDDFNKKHPGKEETWFSKLHNHYQWGHFDILLKTARKNPNTAKIADVAERARMEWWLSMKYEPKKTFEYLKLDKAGDKIFSSPNFELWVKYLNDFNHKYPDKKTTMIDSIRANYKDLNLVDILPAAKKDPSTEKLATNLESALLEKWVDKKVTVAYLNRWIGHKPSSSVWIERYIEKLNKLS